jgi:purine operon repressor
MSPRESLIGEPSEAAKRKVREMAVWLLELAKVTHTYRKLSEMLNLQITVLSRYVKKAVIPSYERSVEIVKTLSQVVNLENTLIDLLKNVTPEGFFDNSKIIGNPVILKYAALECVRRFQGYRVTKILTPAVDGIPIASACAVELDRPLIIAKKTKEVGVEKFTEYSYTTEDGEVVSWYIPFKSITQSDSILIIDDVVRKAETLKAMINLVKQLNAEVAGVYTLITIGDSYKQVVGNIKYETVLLGVAGAELRFLRKHNIREVKV